MTFVLSSLAKLTVASVGKEAQPVLTLDDAADSEAMAADAAARSYGKVGPHYPGPRSPLGATYAASLGDALAPFIAEHLGIEASSWSGEALYSMVTMPPDRLAPIQRMPHYDGTDARQVAVVMFLNDAELGGTAFYRHRDTRFESVTAERFETYKASLEAGVRRHGLPPAAYAGDGGTLFTRTALIAPRRARLIAYRGTVLHCAATEGRAAFPRTLKEGRLTLTAFLRPSAG